MTPVRRAVAATAQRVGPERHPGQASEARRACARRRPGRARPRLPTSGGIHRPWPSAPHHTGAVANDTTITYGPGVPHRSRAAPLR